MAEIEEQIAAAVQAAQQAAAVAQEAAEQAVAQVGGGNHQPSTIYARPPVFTGLDFRGYIKNFRLYLKLQRITNEEDRKRSLLLAVSSGKPGNTIRLSAFHDHIENALITFERFEVLLTELFCPETESRMAKQTFAALRQGPEEDFMGYFAHKAGLWETAYPGDINGQPEEIKTMFIEEVITSLNNTEVKRNLIRKMDDLTPNNLRQMITKEIATEERLCNLSLSENGSRAGLTYSSELKKQYGQYNEVEPMDLSNLNIKCYKCNKVGHMQRDCREKNEDKMNPRRYQSGYQSNNTGRKKETRSCNRCYTPGHLRKFCKIPESKLEAVKRKNKDKNKSTRDSPRKAVKELQTIDEEDTEGEVGKIIDALSLNTMVFLQGCSQ